MHFILTLGVPGTGPYSRVRTLNSYIINLTYELNLYDQGVKKKGRKAIEKALEEHKEEKRQILKQEREKKKKKLKR